MYGFASFGVLPFASGPSSAAVLDFSFVGEIDCEIGVQHVHSFSYAAHSLIAAEVAVSSTQAVTIVPHSLIAMEIGVTSVKQFIYNRDGLINTVFTVHDRTPHTSEFIGEIDLVSSFFGTPNVSYNFSPSPISLQISVDSHPAFLGRWPVSDSSISVDYTPESGVSNLWTKQGGISGNVISQSPLNSSWTPEPGKPGDWDDEG